MIAADEMSVSCSLPGRVFFFLSVWSIGLLAVACANSPGDAGKPTGDRPSVHRVPDRPSRAEGSADDPIRRARRRIERGASAGECRDFDRVEAVRWRHWLSAWCHFRDHRWEAARTRAERALRYFESTGDLRRQIEMHLTASLADLYAGRPRSGDDAHASRAADLLDHARLPLHGPVADPYAGDLPYLLGRASRAGLEQVLPIGPEGEPASRWMLFRTARWNYRQGDMPEAQFAVDLEAARGAVSQMSPDEALSSLQRALRQARKVDHPRHLQRTLAVFVRLARRLELDGAADRVARWIGEEPAPTIPETAPLPESLQTPDGSEHAEIDSWLDRRFATSRGRRLLAAEIAGLRADSETAAHPPPELVAALRELEPADTLGHGDWRLGHQAGLLLDEQGYQRDARPFFRVAVRSLEHVRASIPDPTLRQRFFADKRPVYRALVDSYVGLQTAERRPGNYRRALRTANGLKARGLVDLLRGEIAPEQTVEARRFDREPADDLREAADQTLERLEAWRGPAADGLEPVRFSASLPGGLLERLSPNTAVLEYMLGPGRSYVWVVTDEGMQMRRLAGRHTLEPLVSSFLETVAEPELDDDRARRHRRLAERLYVELLGPVEDLLIERDRLVVAADESLYRLPFEALVRPERDGAGEYVAEHHVVSYTPSTATLSLLESADRPRPGDEALLVGAPDLDRPAIDLLAIADELPKSGMFSLRKMFPELPSGRRELETIGRLLADGGRLEPRRRTGAAATEHFLRTTDLRRFRLLHLTTHGVSDARPLSGGPARRLEMRQPALMLTQAASEPDDGVLTLGEILAYRIGADLVVLSGCTTGRGWRSLGDGAYGLAGAFLVAGARHVVASTWDVADRDTTELMRHLYRALADGASPAAALNAGQRALIADHADTDRPSPYFWAGFRSVGGLPDPTSTRASKN